jgi:hypothetical protein
LDLPVQTGHLIAFGNDTMKTIIYILLVLCLLALSIFLLGLSPLTLLIAFGIFIVIAVVGFFLYRETYKEDM